MAHQASQKAPHKFIDSDESYTQESVEPLALPYRSLSLDAKQVYGQQWFIRADLNDERLIQFKM